MTAIDTGLQELKRQHPEWEPWLAVVEEVLRETGDPQWDALVPTRTEAQRIKVPLLAETTIQIEEAVISGLLKQLLQTACRNGTSKMATLEPVARADVDSLMLFKASLCRDDDRVKDIATALGADPEALQAVVALVPLPFLHACNRRWTRSIDISWMEGYCPLCGAWPALGEIRGIERNRYFRCGRCGGEWRAHCLFCTYCGMTDHEQLVTLVPEQTGAGRMIEACKRCLGYVKTFTTLQGSVPAKVILDDLASVDLDVAAVEQGYKRPQGAGYALDLTIIGNGTK